MPATQIINELNPRSFQELLSKLGNRVLVIKFTATWCGPCKQIQPTFVQCIKHLPANALVAEIDVDECLDLYMTFKKHKMVNAIPTFLAFFGDVKRDMWFIPDDSIIGADPKAVFQFFERCNRKATSLTQ